MVVVLVVAVHGSIVVTSTNDAGECSSGIIGAVVMIAYTARLLT